MKLVKIETLIDLCCETCGLSGSVSLLKLNNREILHCEHCNNVSGSVFLVNPHYEEEILFYTDAGKNEVIEKNCLYTSGSDNHYYEKEIFNEVIMSFISDVNIEEYRKNFAQEECVI